MNYNNQLLEDIIEAVTRTDAGLVEIGKVVEAYARRQISSAELVMGIERLLEAEHTAQTQSSYRREPDSMDARRDEMERDAG